MKEYKYRDFNLIQLKIPRELNFDLLSWFSTYLSDKEKNDTLEGLNSAKGYIKRKIAPELSLRQIPDLSFALDESIENGVRISKLIDKAREEDKKLALSAGRVEEDTEE